MNNYFRDFLNGRLGVIVNAENVIDFFDLCAQESLVWVSGHKPHYRANIVNDGDVVIYLYEMFGEFRMKAHLVYEGFSWHALPDTVRYVISFDEFTDWIPRSTIPDDEILNLIMEV